MLDEQPHEVLEDHLRELSGLLRQTRQQREKLTRIEQSLNSQLAVGIIGQISFAVEMTQSRRLRQKINSCLLTLEQRRTMTLAKLRELNRL
jgi:hypothetical protein